jgi:hypothetical protein
MAYILNNFTVQEKYSENQINSNTSEQAKLDFESVENEALNAYLPRIFHSFPFSEDICTTKQCMDCPVFKNSARR